MLLRADSVTAAAATLVEVRSDAGVVLRTLSDVRGGFRLRLPAGDSLRMRVLRPGFVPHAIEPFVLRVGESRTLRIVLEQRPIDLRAVVVRDASVCGRDADASAWQLWEQAQTALQSVVLASEDSTLAIRAVQYEGEATSAGDVFIVDSLIRLQGREVVHPRAHYDALFSRGLVIGSGRAAVFHGPDASYFADDRFALSQCFRLAREDAPPRPGLIGVRFEPNRRARGAKVRGVAWLDAQTHLPVSIVFSYVDLPRDLRMDGLGGYASFATIGSGHWLLSEWQLRMPYPRRWYGPLQKLTDRDGEIVRDADGSAHEVYPVGGEQLLWARGGRVAAVMWQGLSLFEDPAAAALLARRRPDDRR